MSRLRVKPTKRIHWRQNAANSLRTLRSPRNSTSITFYFTARVPHSKVMYIKFQPRVHWELSHQASFWKRLSQTIRARKLSFNYLHAGLETADCSPSWTLRTIKTYFSFKLLFLTLESKLYMYLMALLLREKKLKKKQTNKMKNYEFRRFRRFGGFHRFRRFCRLVIHSSVTAKNMKNSSQNFGAQPLKIQIGQKFYMTRQIWYQINSLEEISSFPNFLRLSLFTITSS